MGYYPVKPSLNGGHICDLQILCELHYFSTISKAILTTKRTSLVSVHSYWQTADSKLAAYI